jgi:hypothetical protein
MANITEILGTDSVTTLLNPTTLTLSGLNSVSTSALTVALGGVNLLLVNNLGAVFNTAATFNSPLTAGSSLVKSGVLGSATTPTTVVAPTTITAATYFVDANFTLPEAVDGQEVTIINVDANSKSIFAATGVQLGAASVALTGSGSTVTLRCFNDIWYVIASHNATIV